MPLSSSQYTLPPYEDYAPSPTVVDRSLSVSDWTPTPPPPDIHGHPEMEHVHIFNLQQTSRNLQSLRPTQKTSNLPSYTASSSEEPQYLALPTYRVKCVSSTGFMNRKPDMTVTRVDEGLEYPVADARFDRLTAKTTITYTEAGKEQALELESGMTQKYTLVVDDMICHWQPGPTKRILELITLDDLLLASFAYAQEPNYTGYAPPTKQGEAGVLHVSEKLVDGQIALEQVLCSAVVMVERKKRRAAKMGAMEGSMGCGIGGGYA